MEEAQEPAAKTEAKRTRRLGRIGDRRVVQLELAKGLAHVLEVVTVDREQTGKDHGERLAVAGECLGRSVVRRGDRFTRLGIADVFDASDDVADFARAHLFQRSHHGHAGADLDCFVLCAGIDKLELLARLHRALHDADRRHNAAVLVELGVENQTLQRCVGVALRCGNALDDRVEQLGNAKASFGRHRQNLFARDAENLFDLAGVAVDVSGRQVDLIEHCHNLEVVFEGEVAVGEGLGLDALGCVDHKHDAFTRCKAAADFVAEVDVARRVDQVEGVALPIHPNVLSLNRDAALTLQVHRVEVLRLHVTRLHRPRDLEDAIAQR